jgi:hypothetical protein
MASRSKIPLRERRAFRPDLRDAELEDRPLLGPVLAYPPILNGSGLFGVFGYVGLSGPTGPLSQGGPSGPISLNVVFSSRLSGGTATSPGGGLTGGVNTGTGTIVGNLMGSIQGSPTSPITPAFTSPGQALELASSSGSVLGGDSAGHNTGPISAASVASPFGGYGASFSSGGNFAASYTQTYNGFDNTQMPLAPASTTTTSPPPTNGAPPDENATGATIMPSQSDSAETDWRRRFNNSLRDINSSVNSRSGMSSPVPLGTQRSGYSGMSPNM